MLVTIIVLYRSVGLRNIFPRKLYPCAAATANTYLSIRSLSDIHHNIAPVPINILGNGKSYQRALQVCLYKSSVIEIRRGGETNLVHCPKTKHTHNERPRYVLTPLQTTLSQNSRATTSPHMVLNADGQVVGLVHR